MKTAASKVIHTLLSTLGMSDENYRALLWDRYKVNSSKDLSAAQATDIVTCLHGLLPAEVQKLYPTPTIAPGTRKRFERMGQREGMATPAQLRMLEAEWVRRSRAETLQAKQAAFITWLGRFGVTRLEWIPREDVGKILRALQSVRPDATPRSNTQKTTIKGA
jgi:hypothetical protein